MNASLQPRSPALWFWPFALAVYLGNAVISGAYAERTGLSVPEWTVGFDLLVLVPLAYVALYRPSAGKAVLAVLALASIGILAGAFIIPQQDKQAWLLFERLRWVYLGALVVGQVALMSAVARDAWRGRAEPNMEFAVHRAIAGRVPDATIAGLLQADARMWLYAFVRNPARFVFPQPAFHTGKHDDNASVQQGFLVLMAMEIPVVHVLLHLFAGPWVAALVTALSAYGWLFLYAGYRATLLRPTTLDDAGIHVRHGLLGDVHVPYAQLEGIERVAFRPRRQRGSLRLLGAGTANVALRVRPGTHLQTLFGRKDVECVYLGLDDPAGFLAAVERRLEGGGSRPASFPM